MEQNKNSRKKPIPMVNCFQKQSKGYLVEKGKSFHNGLGSIGASESRPMGQNKKSRNVKCTVPHTTYQNKFYMNQIFKCKKKMKLYKY